MGLVLRDVPYSTHLEFVPKRYHTRLLFPEAPIQYLLLPLGAGRLWSRHVWGAASSARRSAEVLSCVPEVLGEYAAWAAQWNLAHLV